MNGCESPKHQRRWWSAGQALVWVLATLAAVGTLSLGLVVAVAGRSAEATRLLEDAQVAAGAEAAAEWLLADLSPPRGRRCQPPSAAPNFPYTLPSYATGSVTITGGESVSQSGGACTATLTASAWFCPAGAAGGHPSPVAFQISESATPGLGPNAGQWVITSRTQRAVAAARVGARC